MVVNGGVLEVSRGNSTLVAGRARRVGSAMTARRVVARLSGALSPAFTTGTVGAEPQAREEVVVWLRPAAAPGVPASAPTGR